MKSKTRQIFLLFVLSAIASFVIAAIYNVGLVVILISVILGLIMYYWSESALTQRLYAHTLWPFTSKWFCLSVYGVVAFVTFSIFLFADGDSQALVSARAMILSIFFSVVLGLITWTVVSYWRRTALDRIMRKNDEELLEMMSSVEDSFMNLD